jgi:hypothetical protein
MFNGRKFRALTIADNISCKRHTIYPDQTIKWTDEVTILDQLKYEENDIPERIQVYNEGEFISKSSLFLSLYFIMLHLNCEIKRFQSGLKNLLDFMTQKFLSFDAATNTLYKILYTTK